MPFAIEMVGSIQSDPSVTTDATGFLSQAIDLAFKATYAAAFGGALPISGTFVPALGAVTKVRALAVRAVDGQSLVVRLTSAQGAAQAIPVSGVIVVQEKNAGDELTAISIAGTGRIEFLIGGDQ